MRNNIQYLLCSLLLLLVVQVQSQWSYSMVNSYTDPSHTYFTAALKYDGSQDYWTNKTNKVIQTLNFTYFFMTPYHLIVRVTDIDNKRWEVPHEPPFPHSDYSKKFGPYDKALVEVAVTESPFSFKITRKTTKEVIFDSSAGDFIYSDHYLQFSTSLTTPNIFGLGERNFNLTLGPDGTYSIFARDSGDDIELGKSGHSTYGYHPVYLMREQSNAFNMGLLRSSVGLDLVFEGGKKLTYKVMGGVIDFNFFYGGDQKNTPEAVVKQYHTYLGGWTLQPFWSFGFQQSRWGYDYMSVVEEVVANFTKFQLPLDVVVSDIMVMDSYIDFTIDTKRYPLDEFNAMLNKYKKKWIVLVDAGVAINNDVHTIGVKNDIYLKDPNGTYLEGTVWPGSTHYPDFLHPNASMFWDVGLKLLHSQIPFNGIWLDMNEVASWSPGEVGFVPDPNDILNNPPYKVTRPELPIYQGTIRMDAVHYGNITENYLHNIFAFLEAKATFDTLITMSELVFIMTRASFYGSGKYTAHWTGDNNSSFAFLGLSIPTTINSGLYGMPMCGPDICGFGGNAYEELCARWFQLGALYPFSRDYNTVGTVGQEPWAFGPTLLTTANASLHFRYTIIKHYYAQFLKQEGTGTIFRPVFFEFPTDPVLYDAKAGYIDSQVLIGASLMATPVVKEHEKSVNAYFPQDTWFDFITGKLIKSYKQPAGTVTIDAPLNTTAPIFLRGGYLIGTQVTDNVLTTEDLTNDYILKIGFKESATANTHTASGEMIGLQNFGDSNIFNKCKLDKCLYSVSATIVVSESNYSVQISFNAQGSSSKYELITVSSLYMFGEWADKIELMNLVHEQANLSSNLEDGFLVEELTDNVLVYKFNTPFKVTPGALISINLPKTHSITF